MELIQQKVDGKDISVPPEEKPEAKIIDLMEALKATVGGDAPARKPAKRAPAKGGRKKAANAKPQVPTRAKPRKRSKG